MPPSNIDMIMEKLMPKFEPNLTVANKTVDEQMQFMIKIFNRVAKMVEQQRQRIEQEMTKMVNELDLGYLRKMQAEMHRCAAKCCDNRDVSLEQVQKCVEKCSAPLSYAQSYVQTELEQLQNKLQRCVMDCNDDIRVKMGPNPTDSEIEKFTAQFEKCATKCVDKQLSYMPELSKRMKSQLEKSK